MHTNRIDKFLPDSEPPHPEAVDERPSAPPAFVPLHCPAIAQIYDAAYRRARFDHELDRLFNPEYYMEQR